MTALDLAAARPDVAPPPRALFGLSRAEIAAVIADALSLDAKKAKMRASQLWRWAYHYGITDFEAMTDIGKEMRGDLARLFSLERPRVLDRQVSIDGTRKYLIEVAKGAEIECVFIPDVGKAGALCVSSQVGCTLNCTFCHTGTQALVRNLTAAEIVAQVMAVKDDLAEWPSGGDDRRLSNIVFMGMGEPLLNLAHVVEAVRTLIHPKGFAMAPRRVTVSTAGVVPRIADLLEQVPVNLAVSLHAATDALRDELVPINKRFPLAELFAALRAIPRLTRRHPIFFEYTLLAGVNDSLEQARRLVSLLRGVPAKVNLIPVNPHPGSPYRAPSDAVADAFMRELAEAGITVTLRRSRGADIDAACGQLAAKRPVRGASGAAAG